MNDDRPPPGIQPFTEVSPRRRGRSWALLLVLLGVCALFYAITIVKMMAHQ